MTDSPQLRDCAAVQRHCPGDQLQRFLRHDRDSIYAAAVDDAVTRWADGGEDAGALAAGECVLRAAIAIVYSRRAAEFEERYAGECDELLTGPSGHVKHYRPSRIANAAVTSWRCPPGTNR